ncbi:DUF5565 family protein [Microvirga calopogonii]|uniref:RNA ligase 1 family protein n=1 Tax=Microvirga calopogonii TaxID=2078013 RepID=UPI000E0CFD22|nr:DUF5565 family protein [Microvirga calopogonii]
MKKTPTIFDRDWNGDRSRVVNKPHPDCGWVFAGEGWPTKKIDGTCCMVSEGKLWKRRELRKGETPPDGFSLADHDPETEKLVGWVPVGDGPEDRWHREAFARWDSLKDGTYELVGPKVQGNPENYPQHELVAHDSLALNADVPRDFDGLRSWLEGQDIEGLVFHHPDGRMAKIKLRDFGLKRGGSLAKGTA